ncbi:hypothetical protein F5B22DRAFT_546042 [Xylaria bambusicola]|uniref:uncharacterized protein n=1 Tax=Xylaria bambusicola TaxID=326684 RepID=UPI0020073168|nr:uncharacterized protein F5B22DRAFT_546042 [Xylaria bambusicola]KAI0521656.1 hypothetical protein F5B22DRAFT_546042 [Xylaria bambusicola]
MQIVRFWRGSFVLAWQLWLYVYPIRIQDATSTWMVRNQGIFQQHELPHWHGTGYLGAFCVIAHDIESFRHLVIGWLTQTLDQGAMLRAPHPTQRLFHFNFPKAGID